MRLLIKSSAAAPGLRLGTAKGKPILGLRRLMPAVDAASAAASGLGATESGQAWHVTEDIDEKTNPWDLCHALMRDGLGVGPGDRVTFAEPDQEQRWSPDPARAGIGAAGDAGMADCHKLKPQSENYPTGPADFWFGRDEFSGLETARQVAGAGPRSVRLVHLDTGYDPDHRTKPARLREDLALNFADPRPNGSPSSGAADQKTAAVNPMFGHGTATLALLAGEGYGGARGFEVVPLRVANWVVLFRNSSIAAALDHVLALSRDPATRCDVLSMSMGGLASAAWADAVNALYDAGVVMVTAAGNNFGNLPVRSIVYPARFNRVLAACGVMANQKPYADLRVDLMAGCYGPDRKMRTALSAFTPNTPWARFGCPDAVDQDGGGTSSATPQIAAAAALWLHRQRAALTGYSGWQRVEAVRDALFRSARRNGDAPDPRLGRGTLQAGRAMALAPAPTATLRREESDATDFAILRLLTGLGAAPTSGQRMLELEALQISQRSAPVEEALGGRDPADGRLADKAWQTALLRIAEARECSHTLRNLIHRGLSPTQVQVAVPVPAPTPPSPTPAQPQPRSVAGQALDGDPLVPVPTCRRLRIFTYDPGFGSRMETRGIATATVELDWERELKPGPVGEYLEVVDIDPASERAYAPVDLNRPEILAQDGLEPSEGSPQFHQQMTYAVAMRTIGRFRAALGRVPLWADRRIPGEAGRPPERRFVRRLRIYPHGLREPNAYYSPEKGALLFGYFRAVAPGSTEVLQGGMIFNCLSHDVIAHETTHALLDGLHPRWKEPTTPDSLAFHEAFADIVALFQHFTMPDALLAEIRRARGQLRFAEILGGLARQFGQAIGGHSALRNAIGTEAKPTDYQEKRTTGPHALGEVLVAAVFDAWLQVYEDRTADLVRLATGGTGVLPQGAISQDLAARLAEEAAKLAGHFLNICIRALDYCPPVDVTFGEYLRAMITADRDLVRDDPRGYRVALVEGFRRRGILPAGVQTWSPEAMVWETPDSSEDLGPMDEALKEMGALWHLDSDRLEAWHASRRDAATLQGVLTRPGHAALRQALGLLEVEATRSREGASGEAGRIEVHSVRPLRRVGPDGQVNVSMVIEVTQRWTPMGSTESFRGGCTIIWDRTMRRIRYLIFKRVGNAARIKEGLNFRMALSGSLRSNYLRPALAGREPFALTHSDH